MVWTTQCNISCKVYPNSYRLDSVAALRMIVQAMCTAQN